MSEPTPKKHIKEMTPEERRAYQRATNARYREKHREESRAYHREYNRKYIAENPEARRIIAARCYAKAKARREEQKLQAVEE